VEFFGHGWGPDVRKEDSSFSEEKEAKRLLSVGLFGPIPAIRIGPRQQIDKSFLFLFFKKENSSLLFTTQPATKRPARTA
jgi:hypothetical protein